MNNDRTIDLRQAKRNTETFVEFNINGYVMVQLTDYGRKALRDEHDQFWSALKGKDKEYIPPEEDENGWSKWQMWDLIEDLGEHVGFGKENPFDSNIKIDINRGWCDDNG